VRVVLDTDVLVTGLLSATGAPGWISEAVLEGALELALDEAIRQEYDEVLHRAEFQFPPARIDDLLATIDRVAFVVAASDPWPFSLPDHDDEPFLAVARASASVLVTGNLRHFFARIRAGVTALSPRELIERMRT